MKRFSSKSTTISLLNQEDQACISFLLDCLIDHVKEYGRGKRLFRHARRLFSSTAPCLSLSLPLLSRIAYSKYLQQPGTIPPARGKVVWLFLGFFLWTNGACWVSLNLQIVRCIADRFLLRRIEKLLIAGWDRDDFSIGVQSRNFFVGERSLWGTWCWSRVISELKRMMNVSL